MKAAIALLITGALSLVFGITSYPPYLLSDLILRFLLFFSVCAILLAVSLLPWYKTPFSASWRSALLYGYLITFTVFDLGFITFSISTIL